MIKKKKSASRIRLKRSARGKKRAIKRKEKENKRGRMYKFLSLAGSRRARGFPFLIKHGGGGGDARRVNQCLNERYQRRVSRIDDRRVRKSKQATLNNYDAAGIFIATHLSLSSRRVYITQM